MRSAVRICPAAPEKRLPHRGGRFFASVGIRGPETLIPGKTIDGVNEDLRAAERVEQYRLGKAAVYIPAGLKWKYIPRSEILEAAADHRTVNAGHCVTVQVRTPSLHLVTAAGAFDLNLEKQASLERLLGALGGEKVSP